MEIAEDYCILCCNRGCEICRKQKFLAKYEKWRKSTPNKYGCYCTPSQLCEKCKLPKIEEKGLSPEYKRLLNLWLFLKDNPNGLSTTGRVADDEKIIELFGNW